MISFFYLECFPLSIWNVFLFLFFFHDIFKNSLFALGHGTVCRSCFFYICAIHSSSRHEKCCQMRLRLFSLFQGSIYQQCNATFFPCLAKNTHTSLYFCDQMSGSGFLSQPRNLKAILKSMYLPSMQLGLKCQPFLTFLENLNFIF